MTPYILILIFGAATSQSGITTVTAEFNSHSACAAAAKIIVEQVAKSSSLPPPLRAQACVPKG